MYKQILIFLCISLLNIINVYGNGSPDESPHEITAYYMKLIEDGIMKPLNLLEISDNEKYKLVLSFLSENDNIEDYYYSISVTIILDGKTKKIFNSIEDFNENIYNYEYFELEHIEYAIYYYERLFNKYRNTFGDPTGKCFSLLFNENYEFIRRVYWR